MLERKYTREICFSGIDCMVEIDVGATMIQTTHMVGEWYELQ